ncbi:MAG: YicC family protein [Clostridia bacterium]|uniref:YicC/YloC family endoribonuclease n=1 Tax=Pumilibacter muris TaxID=2941510 RepID=UPI00204241FA|nr:YicC/YloC family endoribonuclease [Pumilibacter muris]MCI8595694.1 YicC family protein [Clostridia bacterium]
MKSMTGYGKGTSSRDGKTVTVELKAVNNRYLEINSRLGKSFAVCDEIIRKEVGKRIKRGSVDVYFSYENASGASAELKLDLALASEYVKAAKRLRDEFMLDGDFGATALLRSSDVVSLQPVKDDPELIKELTRAATVEAAEQLNAMRECEGASAKADLTRLTASIVAALELVIKRAPAVVEDYRNKLQQRMSEILKDVPVDEARLLNEVAFFADKCDINEEISRLSSHLNQFLSCLESDEPQGRKLDFLSQEMNREINTMGSKSNDMELTRLVVEMKNQLEKIKEQIRNVE